MLNRRQWIGSMLGGIAAWGGPVPWLWRKALAASNKTDAERMLVLIELDGGNDGLNTVVPYADDLYHRARPTLRIADNKVLKLDSHLGLHPALKELWELWEQGCLHVVENVGYPSPNRSHFRSMEIWQSGTLGIPQPAGWLGRAAESEPDLGLCFIGDTTIPLAVRQRTGAALSVDRLIDLQLQPGAELPAVDSQRGDLARSIESRMRAVSALTEQLPSAAMPATVGNNEDDRLLESMQTIRALVGRDLGLRVYYVRLSGFDTHAGQAQSHAQLLSALSRGVGSLFDGLRRDGLDQRVLVMVMSEFGRRVAQNGQNGTDHGAAAPMFLVGPGVAGGISGGLPDLANLDGGDLRYQVDFRDVYAQVLAQWLKIAPQPVLGRQASDTWSLFG